MTSPLPSPRFFLPYGGIGFFFAAIPSSVILGDAGNSIALIQPASKPLHELRFEVIWYSRHSSALSQYAIQIADVVTIALVG